MKKIFYISAIVILMDQALKFWVKTNMSIRESIDVATWFQIYFVENPGMAFGMELGGEYGKLLLTIFRIIVVLALFFWIYRLSTRRAKNILVIPLILIFAGAVGNIIDSLFYGLVFDAPTEGLANFMPEGGGYGTFMHGRVVDMFYFPLWEGYLPPWMPVWGGEYFVFFPAVFNIADAAVSVGVILLLLFQKQAFDQTSSFRKSNRYIS